MPLQISEIGVRMTVGGAEPNATAPPPHSGPSATAGLTPAQIEEIVSRCVREVLSTLRMQESR